MHESTYLGYFGSAEAAALRAFYAGFSAHLRSELTRVSIRLRVWVRVRVRVRVGVRMRVRVPP